MPKYRTRSIILEVKQIHFFTNFPMITFLCFLNNL